jgi:hypothetical protein
MSEWTGPFESGEECTVSHTWEEKGTYRVKVKAKDAHGMQSEWSDPLSVSIPRSKSIKTMLHRFIENYPFLEVLLKTIFRTYKI